MANLRTCATCIKAEADCTVRDALQAACKASAITVATHRCTAYAPLYRPGDPIEVLTLPYYPDADDHAPDKDWYPATFQQFTSTKRILAFVAKGTESVGGGSEPFEPNGNGFLKVPRSRARAATYGRARAFISTCGQCGATPGLGQACARDPHYGSASKCQINAWAAALHQLGFTDGTGRDVP